MDRQIIVTIGREYGSAGHLIAEKLSEKLGINLYDRKFIEDSYELIGYSREILEMFDEKPVNVWFSKRLGKHSTSIENHVQQRIFDFVKDKAQSGESFIIVGRCADYLLQETADCITVFIHADKKSRAERIVKQYGESEQAPERRLRDKDKRRAAYYQFYTDRKWGDVNNYDIALSTSSLGIEKCAEIIADLYKSK